MARVALAEKIQEGGLLNMFCIRLTCLVCASKILTTFRARQASINLGTRGATTASSQECLIRLRFGWWLIGYCGAKQTRLAFIQGFLKMANKLTLLNMSRIRVTCLSCVSDFAEKLQRLPPHPSR